MNLPRVSVPDPLTKLAAPLENPVVRRVVQLAAYVGAVVLGVRVVFDAPIGTIFNGAAIGMLYGLMGVGIVLIYRTNRIINFAAASLGAVPAVLMVLLNSSRGVPWAVVFPLAIVLGVAAGALADFLIVRRFRHSPRLILTVATIGMSQLFSYFALMIPFWMGQKTGSGGIFTPFRGFQFQIGTAIFSGDHLFSVFVVAVVVGGLAAFLKFTRMGIALRASAENADRASLLGIPVSRVQMVSWMLAGGTAAVVIFQRVVLIGVPTDGSLGLQALVYALTAAVVARMESIPVCLLSGMGVGVVASATLQRTGRDSLATAIMLLVILGALFLQRRNFSRAYDMGTSSWQQTQELRPVPLELRGLRPVMVGRAVMAVLVLAFFLALPWVVGRSRISFANLIIITAILAVSLVVLTGWGGQISLGQAGIAGVAAMAAGGFAANHNGDFFVAMVLGIGAGVAASILIGLPALRIKGLYLAVTTLAFAATVQYFLINPTYPVGRALLPKGASNIDPPCLWERVCLASDLGRVGMPFYYVCLTFLGLTVLAARAYRRNRAGRAVVAVSDNTRGATSYGVSEARTKLAAFAVAGGIASIAGVLQAYQSAAVDASSYGMLDSLRVFLISAIGGLTSLTGVVFASVVIGGIEYFGEDYITNISLLATGPGLLLVLMFLPGGLAEGLYRIRDNFLRRVATKHDIIVPSLLADRRSDSDEHERSVVTAAGTHVGEVEAFDVHSEPTIVCPVCEQEMTVTAAAGHEHLQAKRTRAGRGSGRVRVR
ncbi:MAG TPA: ABC transporter permease [Actinomycetota bacterium]|nr:ABC transporter permease [Actinomycetota bacterium]